MRAALVLCGLTLACRGPEVVAQGHAKSDPALVLDASPKACAACHPDVVAQWRSSLHARAWVDPVFRAEYEPAPRASCRDCHNPPTRAPDSHGIDCATCHVRAGRIVAMSSSPAAEAAHAIELDPALASSERCGTCHQFNFMDDGVHDPGEALQNTLVEWQASAAGRAGRGCVSCHMGERGHGFPGMADAELLAEAVVVELDARQTATGVTVDVRVRGRNIGHAFPTGDVFRQARLQLRSDDGAEASLSMQRWLARTADPDGLDSHVRTLDDTRVPAPGQGLFADTVKLDTLAAKTITWTLELHRLPLARARARGLDDAITRVVVDGGTLRVASAM